MRFLFTVSTPLQLYYASVIVLEKLKQTDNADLLLTEQFPNAYEISQKLVRLGLFSNIHVCRTKFTQAEFYSMQLNAYLGRSKYLPETLKMEHYDYFAISMPAAVNSSIYLGLKKTNPNISVILFEDGTGTYNGEVFRNASYLGSIPVGIPEPSLRTKLYRAVFGRLPKKLNSYTPSMIIVRQPKLLTYKPSFPIEKATPHLDKHKDISLCFGQVPSKTIAPKSIIFIDPARTEGEAIGSQDAIDNLIEHSSKLKASIFIREHPRTTISTSKKSLGSDLTGGLWETFVIEHDLSSCLLVGYGSTAQLAPAMEDAGKPALLLLFKLVFEEKSSTYQTYLKIVDMIKVLYGNDFEKLVHIPSTIDEARLAVDSFLALSHNP